MSLDQRIKQHSFTPVHEERTESHSYPLFRFSEKEIKFLIKKKIKPETANKYATRFSAFDIIQLIEAKITPAQIEDYNSCFSSSDIIRFIKRNKKPATVNKYSSRFNSKEILQFIDQKIDSGLANRYPKRFNSKEISNLIQTKITPAHTERYNSRFSAESIIESFNTGLSPEIANQYHQKYSIQDILTLFSKNILPSSANKYLHRFQPHEINLLTNRDCSLEIASLYSKHFKSEDIIKLHGKVPPQIANQYSEKIKPSTILELYNRGYLPHSANRYVNARPLKDSGIIYFFLTAGISPQQVEEYPLRLDLKDIYSLIKSNCSAKQTKEYPSQIDARLITILYRLQIKPSDLKSKKGKEILSFLQSNVIQKLVTSENFSFLSTGTQSLILTHQDRTPAKEKSVWKISKNIRHEAQLFKLMRKNSSLVNIVRAEGNAIKHTALKLEYLGDLTLERYLQDKGKISNHEIFKYSADIMHGLIEMRLSGIWYHRDLRPANIILANNDKRAVIIDFGIATTKRIPEPKDNRRFGGHHDIISLGQIIYYMATGHHIFSKSKSMHLTSEAEQIRDYRSEVYSNPEILKEHLLQVHSTIEDPQISKLITHCLTSREYHYKKTYRLIKSMMGS